MSRIIRQHDVRRRWDDVRVDGSHVAQLPLGDDIAHTVDARYPDGCVCGPSVEMVDTAGAEDLYLVTHHPLDGRPYPEETA